MDDFQQGLVQCKPQVCLISPIHEESMGWYKILALVVQLFVRSFEGRSSTDLAAKTERIGESHLSLFDLI